jgi:hypothetical protein
MTTFARNELPSDIVTVEQLIVWGGGVLTTVNGTKAIVERTNSYPEFVAQWNTFQSPSDGLRHLVRANVQLNPDVAANKTKKFWMFANELTVGAVPSIFTSN